MQKVLAVILFFCCCIKIYAQDIAYAHKIVDTLTTKYFWGRGALNNGELKAAKYIAKAYKNLGLTNFSNTYFQDFTYPINTFPKVLKVQIDTTLLRAGKDYIVAGNSGQISGNFQLVWYNKSNIPTKKQFKKLTERNFFINKFIVIDDAEVNPNNELFQLLKLNVFGAVGIIILEDKLTKDLSTTFVDYDILKMDRKSIKRNSRTITLELHQKFIRNYQSQNVIAYVKGTIYPDSFIVISAHYDHLGMMGNKVFFPGANDNACGIAFLLNLAKYYAKNPPKKTILFIAFGAEEAGLIGSKYFIEHPLIDLKKIKFEINLDVIGTGSEGLMVVNGAVYEKQFKMMQQINIKNKYVVAIKKRGKAANSDHYWFSEKGVPAFFIYALGGIKAYHDVNDIAKTLPLTYFKNNFRLIRDFIAKL